MKLHVIVFLYVWSLLIPLHWLYTDYKVKNVFFLRRILLTTTDLILLSNKYCVFSTDSISSRETTQLPVQRGICGRLQQISPGEERRSIHRVQPAWRTATSRQESHTGTLAQVLLLYEGSPRFRYQRAQYHACQHQVASAA